jgi:RNA polymerase sigma-70 factor (ECF subfamily)
MGDGGTGDASIDALEQLYRTRYRRFLRLALAIVGSREAADDVVQEAFARALRSRFDYRGQGTLEAWVWRTVVNLALTQSRRMARVEPVGVLEPTATNGSPLHWPELRAAVAALPERQRQALFLRHYAGLEYAEIADVLGVAIGTVSVTLHAAHVTLRAAVPEVRR